MIVFEFMKINVKAISIGKILSTQIYAKQNFKFTNMNGIIKQKKSLKTLFWVQGINNNFHFFDWLKKW